MPCRGDGEADGAGAGDVAGEAGAEGLGEGTIAIEGSTVRPVDAGAEGDTAAEDGSADVPVGLGPPTTRTIEAIATIAPAAPLGPCTFSADGTPIRLLS